MQNKIKLFKETSVRKLKLTALKFHTVATLLKTEESPQLIYAVGFLLMYLMCSVSAMEKVARKFILYSGSVCTTSQPSVCNIQPHQVVKCSLSKFFYFF